MILRDIRYATRTALRQPGLTLVILLTLAVGIGANSAIFTLLTGFYLAESPAPDPERVFRVRTGTVGEPAGSASYLDAELYREAVSDVGDLAIWAFFGGVVGLPAQGDGPGENRYAIGVAVSPEFFELLGARFALGRGFLPDEDRPDGAPVAVVNHVFWRRYLGSDPAIVGKTIRVNNAAFTVVGVTDRGFQDLGIPFPIHVPVSRLDDIVPEPALANREIRRFASLFRLREGATHEATETRLANVGRNLDETHPWPRGEKRHITLQGITESTMTPKTGEKMMAGAVGLLLLLASANVANLLLVRAAGRRREMAVLAALGASRWRIAQRLLTESVLLAVAGGALGIAFGRWVVSYSRKFVEVLPFGMPDWADGVEWLELDGRVLVFTFAVSVATGCLFGLAPILHVLRADLVSALKSAALETKPGRRLGPRQGLVLTQVVLSTVLVLGAGLLMRSLADLRNRDVGFETGRLALTALSSASPRGEAPEAKRQGRRDLYELGRKRLAEVPGVVSATLVSYVPASGFAREVAMILPERPDEELQVDRLTIGPDFFATFGHALVKGRLFNPGDRPAGQGVVIVNVAFVERFWSGEEALGREIRLPSLAEDTADDRFLVVGVAVDIRHASRRDEPAPLVYMPYSQHMNRSRVHAVARTAGPPPQVLPSVREALATAHPDLALIEVGTYERQVVFDLVDERLMSAVATLFGFCGVGLACLGIYSVMSCSVSYRLRELGIRVAVGATARDLVKLVLGEAFVLVAAGVAGGVGATLVLARVLSSLLYGVAPHDPVTFLPLPLLLAAVGLAAAWVPARRAARVDPNVALREE